MQEIIELLSTPEGINELFDRFSELGILVGLFLVILESFILFSFLAYVINRELLPCLHECLISFSS